MSVQILKCFFGKCSAKDGRAQYNLYSSVSNCHRRTLHGSRPKIRASDAQTNCGVVSVSRDPRRNPSDSSPVCLIRSGREGPNWTCQARSSKFWLNECISEGDSECRNIDMVDADISQIIDKTSRRLHDTVRREYKSLSNIEDVRNIEYTEKRKWEKLERLTNNNNISHIISAAWKELFRKRFEKMKCKFQSGKTKSKYL